MIATHHSFEQSIPAAGRFVLHRRLGAGGMGVVYEAFDRERDELVALKTLRRASADGLYLFKQEFRALADVTHPNLVTLYELLAVDDQWFFTMELLRGRDALAYLRGLPHASLAEPQAASGVTRTADVGVPLEQTSQTSASARSAPVHAVHPPVDADVMRPVLRQLAAGLGALHATGYLHRDIKPSNVLVTDDGRVVVLDYGVVTAMSADRERTATWRGTPAYMAPEQATGQPATPASDWYAVGLILYEALAGRRPFIGADAEEVLSLRRHVDPLHPSVHVPGVDPALAGLCMRLLAREPARRPGVDEVLRALGEDPAEVARSAAAPPVGHDDVALIGRSRELARLRAGYELARSGHGAALRIKGPSGCGKTALIERFLDDIARDDGALVLAGRCYERESVPHQAVDGLVDALCQHLLELPREVADALMPVDVLAMARAFPVLARVEAVAQARRRSRSVDPDPVELRRRAHGALRELIARLAERRPLVLFIDDLQWGDVDSAPFLADLLRPPVPPLLLLVAYRSEDVASSALLRTLLDPEGGALARAAKVSVGRLPMVEARRLAAALLDAAGAAGGAPGAADAIARESQGIPFFVHELVRYVTSTGTARDAEVPSLDNVLRARAAQLSDDARRALEVVAVAGKPIGAAIVRRAATFRGDSQRAIAELRTAHLVRTSGAEGDLALQAYHDRIRHSVVEHLAPDELRATHLRLAHALVAAGVDDPEALARHHLGGGDHAQGSAYAEVAGDKAADALAFERAAAYFQVALELAAPDDDARRVSLGRRLGIALVDAGRGAESPPIFLAAAAAAGADDAIDLHVRAGSELLRAGRVEDGVRVLGIPLADAGITLPRSRLRAALGVLWRRAHARLRGLGFTRRTPAEAPARALVRIDGFHAVAAGLAMVDPLRGAYVQVRHLLAALRTGDTFRVGRALSYEAGFLSINGARLRARVDRILDVVRALGDELDAPYLRALLHTHAALAAYQRCEWRRTLEHADQAARTYERECTGSAWERSAVHQYGLWALSWSGELRELAERTRAWRQDARERGDLYATVVLNIGLPGVADLIDDDVAATRARIDHAAAQWRHRDYHLQHYWVAMALAQCELYAGDPAAASARIEAQWPLLRRALLLSVVMLRAEVLHLRARCALAAAEVPGAPAAPLRLASRLARRLARERLPWCRPAAELLLAGVAHVRGDDRDAARRLEVAEAGLRAADTHALAAAASFRRGALVGGDAGRALTEAAGAWARAQRVVNVDALMRLLAPGFAPRPR